MDLWAVGEGGRGLNGERQQTYTIRGQDGQLVRSCCVATEPSLALGHNLEGWRGRGGRLRREGCMYNYADLRRPMQNPTQCCKNLKIKKKDYC